MLKPTKTKT